MNSTKMTPLFNVEDIERSTAFYTELGFEVESTWNEGQSAWRSLRSGDLQLMLNQTARSLSKRRRENKDYSDLVLYLYVEDVRRFIAEHPMTLGKTRHVGPQSYGLNEVWYRDPDGYHIVVASDVKV